MIRRLSVAVVALALYAAPAFAQGLEFSGGVNFAKLSGDDIQDAAQEAGLNFGIDLVIPVGPVGLNIGGDWSQKGVKETVALFR